LWAARLFLCVSVWRVPKGHATAQKGA
jgi:hypothetical protein